MQRWLANKSIESRNKSLKIPLLFFLSHTRKKCTDSFCGSRHYYSLLKLWHLDKDSINVTLSGGKCIRSLHDLRALGKSQREMQSCPFSFFLPSIVYYTLTFAVGELVYEVCVYKYYLSSLWKIPWPPTRGLRLQVQGES